MDALPLPLCQPPPSAPNPLILSAAQPFRAAVEGPTPHSPLPTAHCPLATDYCVRSRSNTGTTTTSSGRTFWRTAAITRTLVFNENLVSPHPGQTSAGTLRTSAKPLVELGMQKLIDFVSHASPQTAHTAISDTPCPSGMMLIRSLPLCRCTCIVTRDWEDFAGINTGNDCGNPETGRRAGELAAWEDELRVARRTPERLR